MENKDYRAYLEPDEYVVWQGKPQKGNYFYREDIARIPFGEQVLSPRPTRGMVTGTSIKAERCAASKYSMPSV